MRSMLPSATPTGSSPLLRARAGTRTAPPRRAASRARASGAADARPPTPGAEPSRRRRIQRRRVRLIVTRPSRRPTPGSSELSARGVDAVALPLIEIAPAARCSRRGCRVGLAGRAAWSSSSARTRSHASSPRGRPAPPGRRLSRPPRRAGHRRALRAPACRRGDRQPAADAAQFDSESLWARLQRSPTGAAQRPRRARRRRPRLAGRAAAEAGAPVDAVAAYRRLAPRLGR